MRRGLLKIAFAVALLFGAAAGYLWLRELNGAEGASYRLAGLERGIDKCVVRCANCHRVRTAKQFGSYRLEELTDADRR